MSIDKIVFYGGTGQAKVMKSIADFNNFETIAVFDDTPNLKPPFLNVPLYAGSELDTWIKEQNDVSKIGFCISIGNPHGEVRIKLSKLLKDYGLKPVPLIHPAAIIAADCSIGEGVQIHAGSIIGENVKIGDQCIINTKASIDHECILGNGVEVAPGATLCGCIELKDYSTVFAGATVLPRIKIGKRAIVGAGSLVNKDVESNFIVVGNPAKLLKKVEDT